MTDIEPAARRIAKLVEAIGAEVTLVDREARIIASTAGSRAALGYDQAFWNETNLFDIAHPDDIARAQRSLHEILATPGGTGQERFRARHAEGHWEAIEVHGKNLLDDPDVGALVLTTRSVTVEEDLRTAYEGATRDASFQAQYVASVSHELRSPLQGILGVAQLLEGQLTGEEANLVAVIRAETDRLRRVIDDILDYAKATQGRMEIEPRSADLHRILDAVISIARPQLLPGVHLGLDVDPALPLWVRLDDLRLHQVLLNLTTNATRFTTDGTITLRCRRTGERRIHFAIIDTGTGIDPDKIDSLFEPFRQGEPSRHRQGTGLGLTISRELIELMGGRLEVESVLGIGSTFSFEIDAPTTAIPPEAFSTPAATPIDGRRATALVVDDAEVNRLVIGRHLEAMGFDVDEAQGGLEGVAMATEGQYELIVIDWHMPTMDGLEATRRIRAHETTIGRHTPIMSMTASAMAGDKEKCLAAGVDGFLAKPATRSELAEAVAALVKGTGSSSEIANIVPITEADTGSEADQPVVDGEVLATLVAELGTASVAGVVETYLRDLDARGQAIIDAIAADEPAVARREAHTLKSPSLMLGAVELGSLCSRIEIPEFDTSSGIADDLRRCLAASRDGLRRWLSSVQEESV